MQCLKHPSVIKRHSISSFLSSDDGLIKPKHYSVEGTEYRPLLDLGVAAMEKEAFGSPSTNGRIILYKVY